MAIEYPADKAAGVWAIKLHQALFGTAASSAKQLDFYINDIQTSGTWAFAKAVTGWSAFKNKYGKGDDFNSMKLIKAVYKNVCGRSPTKDEINALKDLSAQKIIKKVLTSAEAKAKLDECADIYLKLAAAHKATYGVDLEWAKKHQPPTDISLSMNMVNENALNHTEIGVLSATDPNANETFTFRILDQNSPFAVFGNKLVVANPAALDFEAIANGKLWVTVEVTDSKGHTYTEVLEILVKDVAEKSIFGATNQVDILHGTAQDDTFIANVDETAVNTTANPGDHFLGEGGYDTLHIFYDGNGNHLIESDNVVDGLVTEWVERIKVTNLNAGTAIIDASKFSDVEVYESHTSKGDVEFRNIGKADGDANGTTISAVHTKGDIHANFAWGTLNGANDVINVHLDAFGEKCIGNEISFSQDHDNDPASIEQINLVSDGKPSHLRSLEVGSALKTLVISGDADLVIGHGGAQTEDEEDIEGLTDENPNLVTVDASAFTAKIDIRLDSVGGNAFTGTYKGGSGDDAIRLTGTTATLIDGGAGINRLVLWDFEGVTQAIDLERIQLVEFEGPVGGDDFADESAILNLDFLDGVQTIKLREFDQDGAEYGETSVNFVNIDDDSTIKVQVCNPEECDDGKEQEEVLTPAPYDPCVQGAEDLPSVSFEVDMNFDFGSAGFDEGWEAWEEGRDIVCIDIEQNDIGLNISGDEIDELQLNIVGGVWREVTLTPDLEDLSKIVIKGGDGLGTLVLDGGEDDDGEVLESLTTIDASLAGTLNVVITDFETQNNLKITTANGNDFVEGSDEEDYIRTNGGTDRIEGEAGDDKLDAGSGNDCLAGGYGKDVVNGGAGADCMYGGNFGDAYGDGEQDTFIIQVDAVKHADTIDVIKDFEEKEDSDDTYFDVLDFVGNNHAGSAHNFIAIDFEDATVETYELGVALANSLFLANDDLDYASFEFGGDTYVVSESNTDANRKVDQAVQLVGVDDFSFNQIIAGMA